MAKGRTGVKANPARLKKQPKSAIKGESTPKPARKAKGAATPASSKKKALPKPLQGLKKRVQRKSLARPRRLADRHPHLSNCLTPPTCQHQPDDSAEPFMARQSLKRTGSRGAGQDTEAHPDRTHLS